MRVLSDEHYCGACSYAVGVLCHSPDAHLDDACSYTVMKSHPGSRIRLIPGLNQVARVAPGAYTYFTFHPPAQQATFRISTLTSGVARGYLTNGCVRVWLAVLYSCAPQACRCVTTCGQVPPCIRDGGCNGYAPSRW